MKMRWVRLRRDNGRIISIHETENEIVQYLHQIKNGMVAWHIQRHNKDGEILDSNVAGGYALANKEAERYINSEILRVKSEVNGMRWE